MEHILIIDDEVDICLLLEKFLTKKGYQTTSFNSGQEGINWLRNNSTNLVLCDFKLPDYNGLEILQKIKIIHPNAQVIIITGYSDVKVAVDALKKGAYDYVTKPLYPDEILHTIKTALETPVASSKLQSGPTKSKSKKNASTFISGKSPQSVTVVKHIELIAPTDMTVIVLGETGTGKEYVARAIQHKSNRKNKSFVAVDCGALPESIASSELFGHKKGAFTGAIQDKKGYFEQANGGTLFLDEIGNLTYENQVKLLRVLQERKVTPVGSTADVDIDIRLIVATNENLLEAVKSGDFREDIYHRLNEFKIELSPLRDRKEDVDIFAKFFLEEANEELGKDIAGFDDEAWEVLRKYYWQGNLREMRNVIKRAALLCKGTHIQNVHLPEELLMPVKDAPESFNIDFAGKIPSSLKAVAAEAEKLAILEVFKHTSNKVEAASILGVDRKTLYNKMNAYGIDL